MNLILFFNCKQVEVVNWFAERESGCDKLNVFDLNVICFFNLEKTSSQSDVLIQKVLEMKSSKNEKF